MTESPRLTITENAAKRINDLIASEGGEGLMLRLAVSSGGCSGFQYGFDLDAAKNDDDLVFEDHGVRVVIDEMSLQLVDGSEVDYVDDLIGAYFRLSNPNASSSCGCGVSFAV
ncbi:MAG: iron-sulfur cluster insertion protein ErpA [Rhodospirillales bacterium]|jgi:iron-sulfur cluster insertion protein|nr:iron-sulfur cluster insertion protein ErpA [Rhodospirillaceae bacterium]MDP6428273.1 iron-sulfur cluster insertion protein ErpA [Rhodospirillales bacterium]MDP6646138.1 iron-sulfur cluster insertion protein ErpA [Rhodospirillales bacterium]MDP6840687.1 iron-sulfur cluster insertion protein ErpA [Rhodospirillales bacterium]|tara:strand:+ start:296 stop:634 length:339 start_codon:yes stop_codon:yes gene_type:complete